MKTNINNLDLDLKNLRIASKSCSDKYYETMETFLKEVKTRYETLECMFNKMNDAYKDLVDFYALDVAKYTPGEFFGDLKQFCAQFQQCDVENRRLREAEEKQKRCEEERAQREKEKQARLNQRAKLMQQTSTNRNGERSDTGVMDNLLEALQNGQFFEPGPGSNSGGGKGLALGRGRRPIGRRELLISKAFF